MNEQQEREVFDAALEALGQADFQQAAELFSEIVGANPENSEAWAYLGLCYLETGQTESAIEALEQALAVEEENADIHYLLGNAVSGHGEFDRAAACYRRALGLDPHHQKAEEALIRVESILESRRHYRIALRILTRREPPDRYLDLALREMLESIAIYSDSPAGDDLSYCVREILAQGREVSLEVPVTGKLARWARLCGEGHQALRAGEFSRATRCFEEAVGHRDTDAFVFHALALSLYSLGRTDEALRAWMRVTELDPDFDLSTLTRLRGRT